MARYADTLLAEGERIALRTRQHWLALIIDSRTAILIFVASLVILILSSNLGADQGISGGLRTILGYVALVGFIVAILWIGKVVWNWYSEDYIVTNRRVLKVEGILNKHSADSSLEKINDAVLDQNILGRMLGYGDLDILTANEESVDQYRMLQNAPTFKKEMLNQKHQAEQDMIRVPSPPIRAAGPAAAPAPEPGAPSMSPDQVTATLASLADLRDRGAISPEEYEAKKAELLGRL
jgi:hypothetical protein